MLYKSGLLIINMLYCLATSNTEPIMLLVLPIIPSRISKKIYPLFFIYSHVIYIIVNMWPALQKSTSYVSANYTNLYFANIFLCKCSMSFL